MKFNEISKTGFMLLISIHGARLGILTRRCLPATTLAWRGPTNVPPPRLRWTIVFVDHLLGLKKTLKKTVLSFHFDVFGCFFFVLLKSRPPTLGISSIGFALRPGHASLSRRCRPLWSGGKDQYLKFHAKTSRKQADR